MPYNASGRYREDPARNAHAHPVGATRYHGQKSRGVEHCRCVVVGHRRTGKIVLRRVATGVEFTVWSGLADSWGKL